MNEWLMLGFGLLLTVGTGLFVASEFSLVNLERSDLEARRERGERGLSNSIRALKRTSTHLSGAQLGITLTTMLTGFLVEPALTSLFEPLLLQWGVSHQLVEVVGLTVSMFIATLFSTLIGELVPKKMALSIPLQVNKFVIGFQLAFTWVFAGMIFVLNLSNVQPQSWGTTFTFMIWTVLLLGGAATILGPILGGMLFFVLLMLTQSIMGGLVDIGALPFLSPPQVGQIRFILIGLALMLLVIFRPQGILGNKKELQFNG